MNRPGKMVAQTSTPKRSVRLYGDKPMGRHAAQSVLSLSRFVGSDKVWISAGGHTTFDADDVQRALNALLQDDPK